MLYIRPGPTFEGGAIIQISIQLITTSILKTVFEENLEILYDRQQIFGHAHCLHCTLHVHSFRYSHFLYADMCYWCLLIIIK
jgi:hypothetical protein